MQFYENVSKTQKFITDISESYYAMATLFPVNVDYVDLEEHNVNIKNVGLVARTRFLLWATQEYWDFSRNVPGSKYGYELWREMLSYAYKMGDPPVLQSKTDVS
jgi:hypothetical protein